MATQATAMGSPPPICRGWGGGAGGGIGLAQGRAGQGCGGCCGWVVGGPDASEWLATSLAGWEDQVAPTRAPEQHPPGHRCCLPARRPPPPHSCPPAASSTHLAIGTARQRGGHPQPCQGRCQSCGEGACSQGQAAAATSAGRGGDAAAAVAAAAAAAAAAGRRAQTVAAVTPYVPDRERQHAQRALRGQGVGTGVWGSGRG